MGHSRRYERVLRFFVLLKHGTFDVVACGEDDIFRLARLRDAGICGVFDDRNCAEKFIVTQQQFLTAPIPRGASVASGA